MKIGNYEFLEAPSFATTGQLLPYVSPDYTLCINPIMVTVVEGQPMRLWGLRADVIENNQWVTKGQIALPANNIEDVNAWNALTGQGLPLGNLQSRTLPPPPAFAADFAGEVLKELKEIKELIQSK